MNEKKYIIELSEQELNNLWVIFDIALKSIGLQALPILNDLLIIFNKQNIKVKNNET